MIFFIQVGDDGPIKVCESSIPEKWLKAQQRRFADELQIIQRIYATEESKAEIKAALRKFRIKGDWFEPGPEVLSFIRKIKEPEYLKGKQQAIAILYRNTEDAPTELCPFCGKSHKHDSNDGFRVAHCMKANAEPFIVTQDGTKLFRKDGYLLKTRCKA